MKKLALKLEELAVTSFETSRAPDERGTVHGNDATRGNTCAGTCGFSCAGTCDISCNASCISTCPAAPCNFSEEGPSVCSIC
ncbi:MAG TPA: pinensin family lanthipeptide [Longimicrobium sp.]|nr:pinensin family lanthipeptide [Longimicrobium sp.]